jgi:predicted porin
LSPAVRLTFGRWGNDKGDSGVSNAITYQSPKMAGLTAAVQYQAGESATGAEEDGYGISFTFTEGAFSTSATLQKLQSADAPKPDFVAGQSQSFGMLSASYDFGVAKLFGQFGEIKNSGAFAPKKTNIYLIGSSIPVTPMGKVLVSYGQSKEKTPDVKHNIFTLAYDHFLSKRTDVYAAYMMDEEKQTGWKKGNSYVLGMRHAF